MHFIGSLFNPNLNEVSFKNQIMNSVDWLIYLIDVQMIINLDNIL
jgi:hypothetical protein